MHMKQTKKPQIIEDIILAEMNKQTKKLKQDKLENLSDVAIKNTVSREWVRRVKLENKEYIEKEVRDRLNRGS